MLTRAPNHVAARVGCRVCLDHLHGVPYRNQRMSENRRRTDRQLVTMRVALRRRGELEWLQTLDVSRLGAFIRTDNARALRELLQLSFHLPNGLVIEGMCMVTRSLPVGTPFPPGPGMGVEFFSVEREQKTQWETFVRNAQILQDAQALTPVPLVLGTVIPQPPPLPPPAPPAPVRRNQPRKAACFLLRMKDVSQLQKFYTRDISQGGCFINTPQVKPLGEDVEIVLIHPDTDEEFHIPGRVARCVAEGPEATHGMGINFVSMDQLRRVDLSLFIETGARVLAEEPDAISERLGVLTQAVKREPDNWKVHLALGIHLLDEMRDDATAVRALLRALELSPACIEAHRKLHRAYVRLRQPSKAGGHLKVAISLESVLLDDAGEPAPPTVR